MTQDRTYVEGRKLTYKQALDLYEKLVGRKATGKEIDRMRRRWLAKRKPQPKEK
jgi:hypothetical protein